MRKILLLFFIACIVQAGFVRAQPLPKGNGRIFGVVRDSLTKKPVEFANVAITDPSSNKPLNGTVCDENGKFVITRLPKSTYHLMISFIGYETKKVNLTFPDNKNEVDLGSRTEA